MIATKFQQLYLCFRCQATRLGSPSPNSAVRRRFHGRREQPTSRCESIMPTHRHKLRYLYRSQSFPPIRYPTWGSRPRRLAIVPRGRGPGSRIESFLATFTFQGVRKRQRRSKIGPQSATLSRENYSGYTGNFFAAPSDRAKVSVKRALKF